MQKDISIITNINKSLIPAVQYALDRGLTLEIAHTIKEAKGKYIAIIESDTYYEDYYLHLCYICLEHANKPANKLVLQTYAVYDSEAKMFYTGEDNKCRFWKKEHTGKDSVKYLSTPFVGCTLKPLMEIKQGLPSDNKLIEYGIYFSN